MEDGARKRYLSPELSTTACEVLGGRQKRFGEHLHLRKKDGNQGT